MDVVGYSKLLIDDQRALQEQLSEIVRNTEQFRAAEAAGKLVRGPAGDGMALVFFDSPEAPLQCAIKISQALKSYPRLQLRMGIHSGPINELKDVNDQTNVAGSGINIAQRAMDCGDAGHILLSKRLAEDLAQSRQWEGHLHDLGECAVKHGVGLSVVNFYTDQIGNPALPERIKQAQEKRGAAKAATGRRIIGLTVGLAVLAAGLFVFRMAGTDRRAVRSDEANDGRLGVTSLPGKSIAVLPFVNMSGNGERVLQRRHHGGDSERAGPHSGFAGGGADLGVFLQRQERTGAENRRGAQGGRGVGRQRPPCGQSTAYHRPAHQRGGRLSSVVGHV